jgi:hypothetical protein
MAHSDVIIRGERFKLAFAPETAYGADPGTAYYTNIFGVVQAATLPDPIVDITPIYALGTQSSRNWYIAYRGRMSIGGSIPDIWLLDGRMLYLGLGNSIATSGANPYTHIITETTALPTISIHATHLDSEGDVALMRRWHGGKVNRMTIEASEGDFLKASIDDIQFIGTSNNLVGENYYSASVADISPTYPTTEPYLFSYGSLTLNGTEFARLRNFRLEINNGLEAKYYITDNETARLPYEHREGKREYRFSCQIDVDDALIYKELIRQGVYTSVYKGFVTTLTFTRGSNDTITITSPANGMANAGGNAMGCLIRSAPYNIVDSPVVSVPLDITMRSVGITIVDSISAYPGNYRSKLIRPSVGLRPAVDYVKA